MSSFEDAKSRATETYAAKQGISSADWENTPDSMKELFSKEVASKLPIYHMPEAENTVAPSAAEYLERAKNNPYNAENVARMTAKLPSNNVG